jgi:hypothetical protein
MINIKMKLIARNTTNITTTSTIIINRRDWRDIAKTGEVS